MCLGREMRGEGGEYPRLSLGRGVVQGTSPTAEQRTVYLALIEARCTVTGVYSTHSTHADKYLVSRSVWLTMPAVSVCVLLLT